ncbi:hypothetical protein BDW02DRAFT_595276 [Decorospora gaudefroyi]|uniref:tRNA/rRNA methyltransferase SpoU type domain-containing protein n=1 Tax=Decorospora gaudefroyi TaxID=184978 RepID=A0A6A5KQ42_9PLEO|nr:hypothetical protein BDW02DRAFT_595276 [Decorospora gaudefroyi]
MATAAVLALLDDSTRKIAFESSLTRLKAVPRGIDTDALDICVRLFSSRDAPVSEAASISQNSTASHSTLNPDDDLPREELWDTVLDRLVDEHTSAERLYKIAQICLNNGSFAAARLNTKINIRLTNLINDISFDQESLQGLESAKAYLAFLKCSFWLPRTHCYIANPESLRLISALIGVNGLADAVHDTLSAFFSLLRNKKGLAFARPDTFGQPAEQYSLYLSHDGLESRASIVNQSVWSHLNALDIECFTSRSGKIFRTWFQWITQAASDGLRLECVEDEQYWKKLRLGLVHGHADQRKYCLGIIRQSFLVTPVHIDTPTMAYDASNTNREKYDQYTTLYETIVLHRYTGQVEASLPTLTALLGSPANGIASKITPAMATTLLAAALDPLVQESIRKMIGRWYMDFVIERRGDISGHINFVFEKFLPWATEGSLFTSTFTATRSQTACAHGAVLATVIARFACNTKDNPAFVPSVFHTEPEAEVDNRNGRAVILGVVRFIMDARGRIFQPAIMYLLDGLIKGLQERRAATTSSQPKMTSSELAEILSLARLTGFPEIAGDLHSVYCRKLCDLVEPDLESMEIPTDKSSRAKYQDLENQVDHSTSPEFFEPNDGGLLSLRPFLDELRESKHNCIQGPAFAPACKRLVKLLNQMEFTSVDQNDLHTVLSALWEEAEIRDFVRPFAVHLPPLLFHPTCIQVCVKHDQKADVPADACLNDLLAKAMRRLHKLSKGRSYVLAVFARSLRRAAFTNPSIISILPFENLLLDFVNDPPTIRSEFLFEVAAAGQLEQFLPHRTYTSYYGLREWHAYAAVVDLIRRFPEEEMDAAKRILDCLLEPWESQKPPVPVKSPWKKTLQLQVMLLLSDFCIAESDADGYIDSLVKALVLESWPRYRYLLEWILARIYYRFPGKSSRIIDELSDSEGYKPIHVASLIKLGLLIAPYESDGFVFKLMTQLNAYSASPKVQIRHEANFAFPLVFELAISKGWSRIANDPAFVAMNAFIRRLEKFNASPWTIRTLKLDIEQEFNLAGIFQGRYLSIESPEEELVRYEDFEALESDSHVALPTARILLGEKPTNRYNEAPVAPRQLLTTTDQDTQTTLQTKAGIDLDNLHPASGPPSMQHQRPASVMMVASLIDNPTNLGGLSRISESFGLEAMYIDDIKKVAHKDFKATSVRSEKHLAIHELKETNVPLFLMDAKSKGYEVIGIEQTDRSGILGHASVGVFAEQGAEDKVHHQDIGSLPKRCCLVLGSEKEGISVEVLAVVDRCVEIKTVGVTRSLNVQTAGGIALYEWWREWGR